MSDTYNFDDNDEPTLEDLADTDTKWESATDFFGNAEPVEEIPTEVAPVWTVNIPAWVQQVERVFDAYHKESSLVRQAVKSVELRTANLERGVEELKLALEELNKAWAKAVDDE